MKPQYNLMDYAPGWTPIPLQDGWRHEETGAVISEPELSIAKRGGVEGIVNLIAVKTRAAKQARTPDQPPHVTPDPAASRVVTVYTQQQVEVIAFGRDAPDQQRELSIVLDEAVEEALFRINTALSAAPTPYTYPRVIVRITVGEPP